MSGNDPKVAELPSVMRTTGWDDYALVDSGGGRKLERYGRLTVVRPERLSLRQQVDLFAAAEVVAGYGGSAMFNAVYARRPGRRIVIASESYVARNEWMIASLKGDDYHHFFCTPELTSPDGRWRPDQFHSPYTFDFARDGAALETLLKE